MYTQRIQNWSLDKKLKAPEALYSLHQIDERRRQGKETEIRIRGVTRTEERLRRYVARSRSSLTLDPDASPPTAVVVTTPPPGRIPSPAPSGSTTTSASTTPGLTALPPGDESWHMQHSGSGPGLKRKRSRSNPSGVRSGLHRSSSLRVSSAARDLSPRLTSLSSLGSSLPAAPPDPPTSSVRMAIAQVDRYYSTYLESDHWKEWAEDRLDFDGAQDPTLQNTEPVHQLGIYALAPKQANPASIIQSVESACQLFRMGNNEVGRRLLEQAHGQIQTLLREQVPPLVACLLSVVCTLDLLRTEIPTTSEVSDPLMLFLKFVFGMASTELKADHPITQLFSTLVEMQTDHYPVAQQALQRIIETYHTKAGRYHPYYCRSTQIYAWVLIRRCQFHGARKVLEHFFDAIETDTELDDFHIRTSRYLLAQVYIALDAYFEAKQSLHTLIARAEKGLGDRACHVTFSAWRMLAVIADQQQRLIDRYELENKALECGAMAFGPHDPRVVQLRQEISNTVPRTSAGSQLRFIAKFPRFGEDIEA
jgi:hypothetical protein